MPKKNQNRPKATAKCLACGMEHIILNEQYKVGQVIQPFAGGGTYGRCRKCDKEGLQIIAIPEEPIKKPRGWRR